MHISHTSCDCRAEKFQTDEVRAQKTKIHGALLNNRTP